MYGFGRKAMEKKKRVRIRFKSMQAPVLVLALLAAAILFSNTNVTYEAKERVLELLPGDTFTWKSREETEEEAIRQEGADYLYLWESGDALSELFLEQYQETLRQMDVYGASADVSQGQLPEWDGCKKVILGVTNLKKLGEEIFELMDWVEEGGNLLIAYPPSSDSYFSLIKNKLGISEGAQNMYRAEKLRFEKKFLAGGDRDFKITDAYEASLSVRLDEDCEVYLVSGDEKENPLFWSKAYEKGKIVFFNLTYTGKAYRGFYAAAYSLMDDAFAWPVINGSTFYIDDFPSPVPSGSSEYIERDYQMTIDSFYTQIWWRDVKGLAEDYGIRYTGLTIEEYSDQVEGPFGRNQDVQRFQYFGNSLLDMGGEIGYHGYNHMPLVPPDFEYGEEYESYRPWKSLEDMRDALLELNSFNKRLFPQETFQVYVPPSNILSEEGRELLKECFPDLACIASVYLPSGQGYEQEFEVAEDGIVETPRVISGYNLDDYQRLAALSELNLHFVNTHFQHPDDVMDEDRGAKLGWEKLYQSFSGYAKWLYESAPGIRSLTGSELAAAVQRYYYTRVHQEVSEDEIALSLEQFQDGAWLLLRVNEGEPGKAEGANLTRVADGLYLVEALEDEIRIPLNPE